MDDVLKPLYDYKRCCKRLASKYNDMHVFKKYKNPRILILDTETTGLDPKESEILQLTIIDAVTGEKIFNEYFKPVQYISWPAAQRIHKITPRKVQNKRDILPYIPIIQDILDEAVKVVGYNIGFDLKFLESYGLEWHKGLTASYDVMDEYSTYFTEDGRWRKLTEVAKDTGYVWGRGKPHNSLGDCLATRHVLRWMLNQKDDHWLAEDLKDYEYKGKSLYDCLKGTI